MLKIKDGIKKFGNKIVIDNITAEFESGKITGLLGENGAGKTTLLRCLIGIYSLDNGKVTLDEKDVYNNTESKEKIGFVTDDIEVFSFTPIKKIVNYYKGIYKNFSEERFHELNKIYKIDINKKPFELSKGFKMRLNIMLNFAIMPKFLLLDEPTNGLDIVSKKYFFEILIDEVEKNNTGIILSSHNLKDLEVVCDKISIIQNGKLVLNNEIDEAKDKIHKVLLKLVDGSNFDVKSISGLIKAEKQGSVYYLYLKEFNDNLIPKEEILFLDKLPISLEEVFLSFGSESNNG